MIFIITLHMSPIPVSQNKPHSRVECDGIARASYATALLRKSQKLGWLEPRVR